MDIVTGETWIMVAGWETKKGSHPNQMIQVSFTWLCFYLVLLTLLFFFVQLYTCIVVIKLIKLPIEMF